MRAAVGIFVYGSVLDASEMRTVLALERPVAESVDFVRATLTGWRQTWDVCTDNEGPQPTHYLDPVTGALPSIQVLFLNLDRHPGAETAGAVIRADADTLARMDRREANYVRTDVTGAVSAPVALPATVYAYVGRPEKVERARRAIADGTARIWDVYMGRITRGWGTFGLAPDMSTVRDVPVVQLTRIARQR